MAAEIKPTKDAVFKIIFGSKSNTELLGSLIESVVGRTLEQIEILNPYVDVQTIKNRKTILDIKVKAVFQGSRETYNVEIQVKNQEIFHNRSLYYWAQSYGSQLHETETYDKLRKHICINFMNFELFDHRKLVSKYAIFEEAEKTLLTDHLQLYFVQMPHSEYNKEVPPENGTMLEKWVYFLAYVDQLNDQEASKLHPSIAHARKDFADIHKDPHVVEAIIMREKDDLALLIHGKKLSFAEQIEEFAKDSGLTVSADLKDDLMKKDAESLKGFVKRLFSRSWEADELRCEIKGFLE